MFPAGASQLPDCVTGQGETTLGNPPCIARSTRVGARFTRKGTGQARRWRLGAESPLSPCFGVILGIPSYGQLSPEGSLVPEQSRLGALR